MKNGWQYLLLVVLFISIGWELVGQAPVIKWTFTTDDMAFGMAALADIDRDSKPEIVFGTYRNDERIIALNAEDGSLLWAYDTGGCNDVAPLIYDVDDDGWLEVVAPGSCHPKTVCLDGATGQLKWAADTHGSDSPPTVADVDGDGKPEILHGEFSGWVICLNGEDGSVLWEFQAAQNAWIQTAPTILDADLDGTLDFVVATWSFGEDHKIQAYRGSDHTLLWESDFPEDVMYHGASHANLDDDPWEELVIGDYSGKLMVLNAEDGSVAWSYRLPLSVSIAAPTSLADLDQDGDLEIIFFDWFQLTALHHDGSKAWQYDIPDNTSAFRGCAISDIDGDLDLDLVFASRAGWVYGVDGSTGKQLWAIDIGSTSGIPGFEFNHGPIIEDFDGDGLSDVVVVGGFSKYPDVSKNVGIAYALSAGQWGGPAWPMFRRDVLRSGCVCEPFVPVEPPISDDMKSSVYYDPGSNKIQVIGESESWDKLWLFDLHGRRIAAIRQDIRQYPVNVPAGIYLYQLISDGEIVATGKIGIP